MPAWAAAEVAPGSVGSALGRVVTPVEKEAADRVPHPEREQGLRAQMVDKGGRARGSLVGTGPVWTRSEPGWRGVRFPKTRHERYSSEDEQLRVRGLAGPARVSDACPEIKAPARPHCSSHGVPSSS